MAMTNGKEKDIVIIPPKESDHKQAPRTQDTETDNRYLPIEERPKEDKTINSNQIA